MNVSAEPASEELNDALLPAPVAELGTLLYDEAFLRGFVNTQSREAQQELTAAMGAVEKQADIAVHQRIPARTAEISGLSASHVKAIKLRAEERKKAATSNRIVPDFSDLNETEASASEKINAWSRATEQSKKEILEHLETLKAEERERLLQEGEGVFAGNIAVAKRRLQETEEAAILQVKALREEFDRSKQSSELTEALSVWGQSPDAKGENGPDGRGYNSGVIHFFAYRADAAKNGRFPDWLKPTIDQFIEYSRGLRRIVDTPVPGKNPMVNHARALADRDGNIRLAVLTSRRVQVIAFSRKEDPGLKIVTAIPAQTRQSVDADVDRELSGNDRKRLNELGGDVREIAPADIPQIMSLTA